MRTDPDRGDLFQQLKSAAIPVPNSEVQAANQPKWKVSGQFPPHCLTADDRRLDGPSFAKARTYTCELSQQTECRYLPQYHLKFTCILIETATGFPDSMAGLNRYCFAAFTACVSKSERKDFTT